MMDSSAHDSRSQSRPRLGVETDDARLLVEYGRVLLRRRAIVVTVTVAVLVVAAVLTFLATPQYKATAVLQIERSGPDILTYEDVVDVDPSWAGYQDFYQTQYRILQSRAVLRMAAERSDLLNRPELAARKTPPIRRLVSWTLSWFSSGEGRPSDGQADPLDPAVAFIMGGLTIDPVRNTHLVRVSFTDSDPVLASDLANAIADAYQQFNLETRYSTTAQANEFLTKQVAQIQIEIAERERALQAMGAEKDILSIRDDTQNITSQALADLHSQYIDAKARLALAGAKLDAANGSSPEDLPEVLNSPLISSLRQDHAEIERRYGQTAERFGPEWPALRQLSEEIDRARMRIDLEIQNIGVQVQNAARADYERIRAEVDALGEGVTEQKGEVERVNRDAIEVESLRSEIESRRRFLERLVNRQSETEVSDRLRETRASNIRTVDLAQPPKAPISPRKSFNMVLGLILGLGLGTAAALVLDHLDNTVKNESDVERLSGLPALGRVPTFQVLQAVPSEGSLRGVAEEQVGLGSHLDPRSPFAEAFKNLRTSILLASPDRPPRNIVITSCEPSDGKSTVSMNLAVVLAQSGRRVLLVDADLRRPRLHRLLGGSNEQGLSSFLTGNAVIEDVMLETEVANLSFIPSGPIPPTPSEILGAPSLQALLDWAAEEHGYDHVVLDSPPVLHVTDAVILASRADATMLVVRAEKTVRESLSEGAARLRRTKARMAGVVLNAVAERPGYYYRYRHPKEGEVGKPARPRRRRVGRA